jgi:hypothetical protein
MVVEINGLELNYEIAGDGEPLLWLHGFMGAGPDWKYIFKEPPAVTAPQETDTLEDRARQRDAGVPGPGMHYALDSERLPLELTLLQMDRPGYTKRTTS